MCGAKHYLNLFAPFFWSPFFSAFQSISDLQPFASYGHLDRQRPFPLESISPYHEMDCWHLSKSSTAFPQREHIGATGVSRSMGNLISIWWRTPWAYSSLEYSPSTSNSILFAATTRDLPSLTTESAIADSCLWNISASSKVQVRPHLRPSWDVASRTKRLFKTIQKALDHQFSKLD